MSQSAQPIEQAPWHTPCVKKKRKLISCWICLVRSIVSLTFISGCYTQDLLCTFHVHKLPPVALLMQTVDATFSKSYHSQAIDSFCLGSALSPSCSSFARGFHFWSQIVTQGSLRHGTTPSIPGPSFLAKVDKVWSSLMLAQRKRDQTQANTL